MRRVFLILLSFGLAGCAIKSYVELSGPGQQISGKCEHAVRDTLSVEIADAAHVYVISRQNEEAVFVFTQISLKGAARNLKLLSSQAKLSSSPGNALVSRVNSTPFANGTGFRYERAPEDKSEVTINGSPLAGLDMGGYSFEITYAVPFFPGTSTEITLPAMEINGNRFEVAPITMRKKAATVQLLCH